MAKKEPDPPGKGRRKRSYVKPVLIALGSLSVLTDQVFALTTT